MLIKGKKAILRRKGKRKPKMNINSLDNVFWDMLRFSFRKGNFFPSFDFFHTKKI